MFQSFNIFVNGLIGVLIKDSYGYLVCIIFYKRCDLISRINQVKLHSVQNKSLKIFNQIKASTVAYKNNKAKIKQEAHGHIPHLSNNRYDKSLTES